jgi:membrane-associated phospholipid phosphatase
MTAHEGWASVVTPRQSSGSRLPWPYDLRVVTVLSRLPRLLFWLAGSYVALVLVVALGLHRAADRALATILWQDVSCWGRTLSERASTVLAAELSVLYALAIGFICLRGRRPLAAGWILFLLLASVGVEITFKYYFAHPSPSAFLETVPRAACGPSGPAYPFTVVSTPSTLPSGYSIRAAYFSLLLAAMIGGRWPALRVPAWLGLGAVAIVAGASRVTVGWHWPTDVIAGLLLGAAFAVLAIAMADGFAWLRPGGGRGRARAPARASGKGRRRASPGRTR